MEVMLLFIGRTAGLGGALACAIAGILRLTGRYALGSFQVGTVLQLGIALMIFGCFVLALVLVQRTGQRH